MKKQMLYHELAKYYDLIYFWKDYKKDTIKIKKFISKYKKSGGKELLDVACGTGQHLKYLKNNFSCTGVDVNKEMLKVARKNVKDVVFKNANMVNFYINKKFDIIMCLFSSIGYVKTYSNLRKTIKNFAKHLKKGGVIIIEPWFTKSVFNHRHLYLDTYNKDDIKIVRMNLSKIRNNISVLNFHYLIGKNGKSIIHFKDKHELGLFDINKTLKFMNEADFKAKFLRNGLKRDRGLFIGIKR